MQNNHRISSHPLLDPRSFPSLERQAGESLEYCSQPVLPLDLKLEVKVRWVKVVNSHVSVFTTTAVHVADRRHCDVVERTEVTTHATNFLLEDLVVETRFEFTLAGRGCRDIHGGLTTTENHKVLDRGDGGGVQRRVSCVGLQNFEVF